MVALNSDNEIKDPAAETELELRNFPRRFGSNSIGNYCLRILKKYEIYQIEVKDDLICFISDRERRFDIKYDIIWSEPVSRLTLQGRCYHGSSPKAKHFSTLFLIK